MNRANASVTVVYTYTSSTAAVATVSAAGMVTAVAPGTTTITVTAAGTGTGFAAATMTTAATITVSDRAPGLTTIQVSPATASLGIGGTQQITASVQGPRASAATMTYGTSAPAIATVSATGVITAVAAGTATITVTAQSTQDGAFAASSLTGLVTLTVTPAAQVVINSLTQLGTTLDINNVAGQFEVNLALQPNGQAVTAVQAWLCNTGETVADCATRSGTPAAEQTYAGTAQAGTAQLYINSAEFSAPNFTTGADADTRFKNGLKTIVATLKVASGATPAASNNVTSLNFNNTDTWTIAWTQPTNKSVSAAGVTWYGGPDTPDALLSGSTSGTSSFVVVPVLYTPNRTITRASLAITGLTCGAALTDSIRPFGGSFGDISRSGTTMSFNCEEQQSAAAGAVPSITASVDNNNAAGPVASGGTITAGTSIYTSLTAVGAQLNAGRYAQSSSYRPTTLYVPFDYVAPDINAFDVRGGGGSGASADSGWVNGAYAFNDVVNTTTGLTRYDVNDNGVGLLASRNTQFSVCNTPSQWSDTSITECPAATAVKNGGLTATVTSMGLGESADLTNRAYFAVVRETDRLGNRIESNPRAVTIPAASSPTGAPLPVPATPGFAGNTNTMPQTFGVDIQAPSQPTVPTKLAESFANPTIVGYVRSDLVLSGSTSTDATTNDTRTAANATFGVRVADSRSGFATCVAGTNCLAGTSGYNIGTFQIQRISAPVVPSATNTALIENLVNTSATTGPVAANAMNAAIVGDGTILDFSISVAGVANRAPGTTPGTAGGVLTAAPATTVAGYYVFTSTVRDRAGNTATVTSRRVLIDNNAPSAPVVLPPSILTGGQTTPVTVQGSDDLEITGVEFTLTYPSLASGSSLPTTIRFPRVPVGGSAATSGIFRAPWTAITDGKLGNTVGITQTAAPFTGTVNLPIPFIANIQVTDASNVPTVPTLNSGADAIKPTVISAVLVDAKHSASVTLASGSTNTSAVLANSSSTAGTANIGAGSVAGPATPKSWGATAVGSDAGAQIASWGVYTASSAAVEFRAVGTSSNVNAPFTKVYVVRNLADPTTFVLGSTNDFIGEANYAGSIIADNGTNRIFRYVFTPTAVAQGNNVTVTGFGTYDAIRAIGVDASGNGLATRPSLPTTGNAISSFTVLARYQSDWKNYAVGTAGTVSSAAGVTSDTLTALTATHAAAPVLLVGGATLIIRSNAPILTTGASTATYACTSSNTAVATAAIATAAIAGLESTVSNRTCVVTPQAPGSASISLTASSTASGPNTAAGMTSLPVTITTPVTVVAAGTVSITGLSTADGVNLTGNTTAGAGLLIEAATSRAALGANNVNTAPGGWLPEVDGSGTLKVRARITELPTYLNNWSFFSAAAQTEFSCSNSLASLFPAQITCSGSTNLITGEREWVLEQSGDFQQAAGAAHTVRMQQRSYSSSVAAAASIRAYTVTPPAKPDVIAVTTAGGVYAWTVTTTKAPAATSGFAGATAALIPQVMVTGGVGGLGVPGVAVTFTVGTTGGTINKFQGTAGTKQVVLTDNNGIAQLTAWTLPSTGTATVEATFAGQSNSLSNDNGHKVIFSSPVTAMTNTVTGTLASDVVFPRNMTNAAAAVAVTSSGGVAANGTLTYSCTSSSALITATVSTPAGGAVGALCTLTPSGVADAGGNAVTITFTATVTGQSAGYTANTVTRTVTVTRIP